MPLFAQSNESDEVVSAADVDVDVEMEAGGQQSPESPAASSLTPSPVPVSVSAPPQTPRGPPSLRRQLFFRSAHKLTMEAQKSKRMSMSMESPAPVTASPQTAVPATPSSVPAATLDVSATPSKIALPSPGGTEWEVADEDEEEEEDVEMAYETDVHHASAPEDEDEDVDEGELEELGPEVQTEVSRNALEPDQADADMWRFLQEHAQVADEAVKSKRSDNIDGDVSSAADIRDEQFDNEHLSNEHFNDEHLNAEHLDEQLEQADHQVSEHRSSPEGDSIPPTLATPVMVGLTLSFIETLSDPSIRSAARLPNVSTRLRFLANRLG